MKFYWEAQLTATYIFNRTVHGDRSQTPYEILYGKKPDLGHLRAFGSVCYAHIPAENRSKLEPDAWKCRLLSYLDDDDTVELKGYKVYRESDLAVIFCRDVRFDKEASMTPLCREFYDDDCDDFDAYLVNNRFLSLLALKFF
jgi:hypothetical protein